MTNPFAPQAQTPPAQFPNADPAYAAWLASQAQAPAYAPAPQFPQYSPQGAPQYPPPFVPPQAPAPALAQGTLDDFYGQPSVGGGPHWKFEKIGDQHTGIISRTIGAGDIEQVTDINDVPQFFKDGRPKFQMRVPVTNTDGSDGTWFVKGADRDELARAMAEAGVPAGPPEKGAAIRVTFVKEKANGAKYSNTKVKQVEYIRPAGTTSAPATPAPAPAESAPATSVIPAQTPAPAPAAVQAPTSPAPAAVTLDASQAALLAQLTGG